MSDSSDRHWPPLITDAGMSRRVVWRDRLMTLGLWLLLVYFSRHALQLIWYETLRLFGRAPVALDPINWDVSWDRLHPYAIAVAILGVWLMVWAYVALLRLRRAVSVPDPAILSTAEEVIQSGCSEAELASWRQLKVAIVHLDGVGRVRVVPKSS
jgi:poly-beta-1,6-N-acetyl-D-glucosamine biosynthesis protein PgaD